MRMATCHPDRKHWGKGLCAQCSDAAYYREHRAKILAYQAAYKASHKAKIAARQVRYYAAHKEERKVYGAAYRAAHKEDGRVFRAACALARYHALKLAAFAAYGGPRCACCGETLVEGLSIDHVKGDGAKHRKAIGGIIGGTMVYLWLKKNNYPPGYAVLCMTCNTAKRTGDHCPHREQWASLVEAWGGEAISQ